MLSKKDKQSSFSERDKLMEYALSLVSKRRLTTHEIEVRLRKKGIGAEGDILGVIERLKELSYLDDLLYASDFIKDRLNFRPRGIVLLKRDMYKRGLKKDVIECAILMAGIDETSVAKSLADRKMQSLEHLSLAKKKEKLFMFLRSRGFAPNVIYEIIDSVGK